MFKIIPPKGPSIKPGTWNIPEHPGTRKKLINKKKGKNEKTKQNERISMCIFVYLYKMKLQWISANKTNYAIHKIVINLVPRSQSVRECLSPDRGRSAYEIR